MKVIEKIVLVLVIVGLFFILFRAYLKEKEERIRFQDNVETLLKSNQDQLLLTKKEFKKYNDSLVQLAKKLEIKVRNITNVIEHTYYVKDTTIQSYATIYDTVRNEKLFDIQEGCFRIKGSIRPDSLLIESKEIKDELTTFLYRKFRKKFWFIKWNPVYTVKTFSKCKNDTISVNRFIGIKK